MGSRKFGKHVIFEIIEVRFLQWEPIQGKFSCQQKASANIYEKHAGSCRGRAGKEGRW